MLESCKNAVSQVPNGLAELHNPKTLRAIKEITLLYARKKINKLKEKERRDADFYDLVKYIESEAKMVTNSLFGKKVFNTFMNLMMISYFNLKNL